MEQYEIFSGYLDGALPFEEEQNLFTQMNYDGELRERFRRFISIDRNFKRTASLYVPPNDVTNKIYSGLGFSIPTGIKTTATASKSAFIHSQFFKYFLTGLGSAIVAVIGTIFFLNSNNDNTNSSLISQNPVTQNRLLKIEQASNPNILKPLEKQTVKYIYIEKVLTENKNENLDGINVDSQKVLLYLNDKMTDSFVINNNLNNFKTKSFSKSLHSLASEQTLNPSFIRYRTSPSIAENQYSLELLNSLSWNLPKETIYPNEISKLNNIGISILYNLSDNVKIGADLRQETFFVKYTGAENSENEYEYIQQPNFTCYGLLLRFDAPLNIFGVQPILQGTISGNYYGIIARGSLGLEYKLNSDFSLMALTEFSNLFFKHQGKWFSASKIGINYGINYNF